VSRTRVLWEEGAQQALFENSLLVSLPHPKPPHPLSLVNFFLRDKESSNAS